MKKENTSILSIKSVDDVVYKVPGKTIKERLNNFVMQRIDEIAEIYDKQLTYHEKIQVILKIQQIANSIDDSKNKVIDNKENNNVMTILVDSAQKMLGKKDE